MTMLYYHIRIWLLNSTTRLKNCRRNAEIKGELILSEKLQSERRRCKSTCRYRQIFDRKLLWSRLSEEISTQEKTVEVQALAAKER